MATIRIPSWITWVPDAESLVLFDGRDGSYHVLNWSASQVWRLLDGTSDRQQVAARLVQDHGLDPSEAGESVDVFLEGALAKGLIVVE